MKPRIVITVALLAGFWARAGSAEQPSAVDEDLRTVAEQACKSVVQNPNLSADQIDHAMMETLFAAEQVMSSKDGAGKALEILDALQQKIGPIDALPKIRMQFMLGELAGAKGDTEKQAWHRKYAIALTQFMEENGTGESAGSAINPCLTSNEYDWLQFRARLGQPDSQALVPMKGRSYDVFTFKQDKRTVYFDITDIMTSSMRVLESKAKSGQH
jgi:hypothetical protein